MVDKLLFLKAATYSDVVLTWLDDDGFPFSIPVDVRVDADSGTVGVSRPQNLPPLQGRNFGMIFNHITPLPIGGYTDRRYIVFWGGVVEEGGKLVFKPTKGYTWNEQEVPFFQYAEIKNPRARSYLAQLKEKPWLSTPWLFLRTFRLPFVIATILPVSLGAVIAFHAGFFNLTLFALTLIGAVLIHMGLNVMNDYFDFKTGADDINTTPTPFSGGSRVVQYALLQPTSILSISTLAYIGGAAIGLYLVFSRGLPLLLIGLLGLLISVTYTAPPFKLVYRGLGELAVGTGFGPLLVLGSYFVQAQRFDLEPLLASLVPGLLVMLILYVNEIPDITWDDEAGKRTLVARMPEKVIVRGFMISIIAAYAIVVLGVLTGIFPATTIIALLTIPLAARVRRLIKDNFGNPYGLMPAMSTNIKLFAYTTLLFLAGYLVSGLMRVL